jgi:hypothetical protein
MTTRTVQEIEDDIRALNSGERNRLLRSLVAELDLPPDPDTELAWLETVQRRYRELAEGTVKGVPGPLVFERLRSRLGA